MNKFTIITKTESIEAYIVEWTCTGFNPTTEIFQTQKEAIDRYKALKETEKKLCDIEIYYKRYIDPDKRYRGALDAESDMTGSEPKY